MSSLWGLLAIIAAIWAAYWVGRVDEEAKWRLGEKKLHPVVDCYIYSEEEDG